MSESLEISITSYSRKEVNMIGLSYQTVRNLGIDLHLVLDCDCEDPIESKLRLVDEALEQLKGFRVLLEPEIL